MKKKRMINKIAYLYAMAIVFSVINYIMVVV